MKGQKVFSYKKGQNVPSWVCRLSGGNAESEGCICVFGYSGKLYVLPNGDIVTYARNNRDRGSSCIYIKNAVGVRVTAAGSNRNTFFWFGSSLKRDGLSCCSLARNRTGIKVTTKSTPIPFKDPGVLVAFNA